MGGNGLALTSPLVIIPGCGNANGLPVSAETGITPWAGNSAIGFVAALFAAPPRFLFLGLLGLDLPPLLPSPAGAGIACVSAMILWFGVVVVTAVVATLLISSAGDKSFYSRKYLRLLNTATSDV